VRADYAEISALWQEAFRRAVFEAAYEVAGWHLLNGREDRAEELFDEILATGSQWAAFGYLAAEAEVARREAG